MTVVYGSLGHCGFCKESKRKLHSKVHGVIACMRCRSRLRYKDPKKRKQQVAAARRYRAKKYAKKNHRI